VRNIKGGVKILLKKLNKNFFTGKDFNVKNQKKNLLRKQPEEIS
jgi:hypothetical protein